MKIFNTSYHILSSTIRCSIWWVSIMLKDHGIEYLAEVLFLLMRLVIIGTILIIIIKGRRLERLI